METVSGIARLAFYFTFFGGGVVLLAMAYQIFFEFKGIDFQPSKLSETIVKIGSAIFIISGAIALVLWIIQALTSVFFG